MARAADKLIDTPTLVLPTYAHKQVTVYPWAGHAGERSRCEQGARTKMQLIMSMPIGTLLESRPDSLAKRLS